MDKENLNQNRRDDRRDIGRKNEHFKNGMKGIKRITGKYNTSNPLTKFKSAARVHSSGHGKRTYPPRYLNRNGRNGHQYG